MNPFKAYRERRGMTLAEMAAVFGVTKPCVFKWERGIGPSPARALEIERITKGELQRWDVRPDLWQAPLEWPDPGAAE